MSHKGKVFLLNHFVGSTAYMWIIYHWKGYKYFLFIPGTSNDSTLIQFSFFTLHYYIPLSPVFSSHNSKNSIARLTMRDSISQFPKFSPLPWSVSSLCCLKTLLLSLRTSKENTDQLPRCLYPTRPSSPLRTIQHINNKFMPIQTPGVKVCTSWPLINLALAQWLLVNSPYWEKRLINLVLAACRKGIVAWLGRCQCRMSVYFLFIFCVILLTPQSL